MILPVALLVPKLVDMLVALQIHVLGFGLRVSVVVLLFRLPDELHGDQVGDHGPIEVYVIDPVLQVRAVDGIKWYVLDEEFFGKIFDLMDIVLMICV